MTDHSHDMKELSLGLAEEVSQFTEAWRIFKKNKMALAGLIIFIIFFMVAVAGFALTNKICTSEFQDE